jgi:hypothetical protein
MCVTQRALTVLYCLQRRSDWELSSALGMICCANYRRQQGSIKRAEDVTLLMILFKHYNVIQGSTNVLKV